MNSIYQIFHRVEEHLENCNTATLQHRCRQRTYPKAHTRLPPTTDIPTDVITTYPLP